MDGYDVGKWVPFQSRSITNEEHLRLKVREMELLHASTCEFGYQSRCCESDDCDIRLRLLSLKARLK